MVNKALYGGSGFSNDQELENASAPEGTQESLAMRSRIIFLGWARVIID
jgi:hypothetical protein